MSTNFSGEIHPYIADLPLFEDKIDEIAESIDEVGLLHPITLDEDGQIIGGRHRFTACEVAGIDPTFEVWEGDPLSFMLHDNDARKHQTTGQLAAEKALTLDKAGWRVNNRWKRGTVDISESANSAGWKDRMKEAGIILDHLGRAALAEIAVGDATLNAKFEQACQIKEQRETAEARKVQAAKDAAERESRAVDFFENDASAKAWLESKPDGAFANMRAAFSAIQEEREEIRAAEEERRRQEEEEQRVIRERIERHARYLEAFVTSFKTGLDMADHPERQKILDASRPDIAHRFIEIENTYLKGAQ